MGTAGLDVNKLAGLLERIKVDCSLVEGDAAQDHCILRLTSIKCPGQVALVEYGNQGSEPRVTTIVVEPPQVAPGSDADESFSISQVELKLRGTRKDDPTKIVDLVQRIFLDQYSKE